MLVNRNTDTDTAAQYLHLTAKPQAAALPTHQKRAEHYPGLAVLWNRWITQQRGRDRAEMGHGSCGVLQSVSESQGLGAPGGGRIFLL